MVVAEVSQTVLSRQEYCVVTDPIDSKGRNQLGKRELRKGVTSFFLHPGKSCYIVYMRCLTTMLTIRVLI